MPAMLDSSARAQQPRPTTPYLEFKGKTAALLDPAAVEALCWYARTNGRHWKFRLRWEWLLNHSLGEELQRVRNVLGPKGLDRVRLVNPGVPGNRKRNQPASGDRGA